MSGSPVQVPNHPIRYPLAWMRAEADLTRLQAEFGSRFIAPVELDRAVFIPLERELDASRALIGATPYRFKAQAEIQRAKRDFFEFRQRFVLQRAATPERPFSSRSFSDLRNNCLAHLTTNGGKGRNAFARTRLYDAEARVFSLTNENRLATALRIYFGDSATPTPRPAPAGPIHIPQPKVSGGNTLPLLIAGGILLLGVATALWFSRRD